MQPEDWCLPQPRPIPLVGVDDRRPGLRGAVSKALRLTRQYPQTTSAEVRGVLATAHRDKPAKRQAGKAIALESLQC